MLDIRNLQVSLEQKKILNGVDLKVGSGVVHAIMGPNGSGKSSLSHVIAGRENYHVDAGEILFNGENILELDPEQRAHRGIFLGMQYPVELPGVNNLIFLREALNAIRASQNQENIDSASFMKLVKEKSKIIQLDEKLFKRNVNEGFSGGEKKRNEILQMLLLEPTLAILDETDSGLDIDALRIIANGINSQRAENRSFILITHYQRLLEFVQPDYVSVLLNGKIVKTGGKELAIELEEKGYSWLEEEIAA